MLALQTKGAILRGNCGILTRIEGKLGGAVFLFFKRVSRVDVSLGLKRRLAGHLVTFLFAYAKKAPLEMTIVLLAAYTNNRRKITLRVPSNHFDNLRWLDEFPRACSSRMVRSPRSVRGCVRR
jgi:hypothetical protein